jgi:hypothetical protein
MNAPITTIMEAQNTRLALEMDRLILHAPIRLLEDACYSVRCEDIHDKQRVTFPADLVSMTPLGRLCVGESP